MEAALRFFIDYEIWIYVLLAMGELVYVRRFILAWDELRAAGFGLERESAQSRLNQSAGMIVVVLSLGIAVFILVTIVSPSVPGVITLSTPTLDLLATPTIILTMGEAETTAAANITPVVGAQTIIPGAGEGCTPGQVMFSEPQNGSIVSGVVTLIGTANMPNFGFFKYEVARPGETLWLTIQAVKSSKVEEELGKWDTSILSPGDYLLRLVVTDNQGAALPPCIIQVRVEASVQP